MARKPKVLQRQIFAENCWAMSADLFDLNVRQIVALARCPDLDAALFGVKVARFLLLATNPRISPEEQTEMERLYSTLGYQLANWRSRKQLAEALALFPVNNEPQQNQ